MSDSQLRVATGKGFGGAGCATRSIPINLPLATQKVRDNQAQAIAKSCDKYMQPFSGIDPLASEAAIEWGEVFVGNPNPHTGVPFGPKVLNCNSCANFVGAAEVMDETGWNAGACLAKGKLLLVDRLSKYARACDQAQPLDRNHPGTLKGVMWNPEYTPRFGEKDKQKLAAKMRSTDPLNWPTDKEVTADDKEQGIRSWRRIEDPEGYGQPVYFPVFDPSIFSPEELAVVPRTGDDEHPEIYHDHGGFVYQLAVLWRCLAGTPAAWGPPGVGKTELARHMAWLAALPFHRISITETSELDDLAGTKEYSPEQGTHFVYGRIPRYWQRPGILGLDEPNVGPPAVWQFIRPLTDDSKQLVLDVAPNSPRVPRHPHCYFMLMMNPAWGLLNVGANTISDADQRRLMHIYMDLPPADIEKKIITDHCMVRDQWDPKAHLDKIMKIASDIREMVDAGTIPVTWGMASQIKVARLMQHYSPMTAYRLALLNYLDPQVATPVVESIRSIYPA